LISVLNDVDISTMVPQLATFCVAAVKLLPSANKISVCMSQTSYCEGGLDNVIELLDEIPRLNIENFTLSETGMILQANKKEVVETMGAGKDMDNWLEVSHALINITDEDGNIYYPVEGGTTGGKKGFYGRFEIDKDLFDDSTFYLNMKIGEEEYTSEIAIEE